MRVFRLTKRKYAKTLNGKGAAKFGNRWNSKETEIIYTGESRALAMAEVIVHLTLANLPKDYMMVEIDIPNSIIITEPDTKLTENWNTFPVVSETQRLGDSFINDRKSCVFKVPSAVVKGDFNFLLNPHHKDFSKIKVIEISGFPFDKRVFKDG